MSSPGTPSRVMRWVLRTFLPDEESEFILGDLEEEFRSLASTDPESARRMYRREVLGAVQSRLTPRSVRRDFGTRTPKGPGDRRLGSDLHVAFRSLLRHPTVGVVVVLTLALGIGALTAIWSVVDGVLLRPLPFPDPDRIVSICSEHPSVEGWCGASPPDALDWQIQSTALVEVGLMRGQAASLRTEAGLESLRGALVTPQTLRILGATTVSGRLFTDAEQENAEPTVILSYAAWQSRFGADPNLIGQRLTLDDRSALVAGVLSEDVWLPWFEGVQVIQTLPFDPSSEENRDWRGFRAIGRLADGFDITPAQEEVATVAESIGRRFPESNLGWRVRLIPIRDQVIGSSRGALTLFLGAVVIFVLVACANVASVLLARETQRRREMAVRAALGASRGDLLRIVVAEGTVLGIMGGAIGIALAAVLLPPLIALSPSIPRLDQVHLDLRVMSFAIVATIGTVILSSLLPALTTRFTALGATLRHGGDSVSATRMNRALVVSETALAIVMLIAAGLLGRSFVGLMSYDGGIDRDHLVAGWVLTVSEAYPDGSDVVRMHADIARAVEAIPGVERAALASAGPLFGGSDGRTRFVDAATPPPPTGEEPSAEWFDVSPGLFETLGIPVVEGRDISDIDDFESPKVGLINETFARRHWPGESPIGKQIKLVERGGELLEIVGVVPDIPTLDPTQLIAPALYWPLAQWPRLAAYIVARTTGNPAEMISLIHDRARAAAAADTQVRRPAPLVEGLRQRTATPRFNAAFVAVFAVLGLTLAAVGLYGVMAYSVSRRTRELGIRVSLGLGGNGVRRLVLRDAMRTTVLGVVIGLGLALVAAPLIGGLIVGVSPRDPLTIGTAVVLALVVSPIAAWAPARRATRVDPVRVLRSD